MSGLYTTILIVHSLILVACYQGLKLIFFFLARSSTKLFDIYFNKALDEPMKLRLLWRQNVVLIASFISFLIGLIGAGILAYLPFYLSGVEVNLTDNKIEWGVVSVGFVMAVVLVNKSSKSTYNSWQILLHELVLNNYNIGKWFFKRAKRKLEIQERNPYLIITGLARSGTTAMLNKVNETGGFKSLSYDCMPFVLSPNYSKRLPHKGSKDKLRAHGDGLSFNTNSIEAFEEYFFKVFQNDDYITDQTLNLHEVSKERLKEYELFRQVVIKNQGISYLAKNNNSALRLKSLLESDPCLRVIVMYREPSQHAISLYNQHEHFSRLQKEDKNIVAYMDWLGHHEFGVNHKQFLFKGGSLSKLSPTTLDYWLERWCEYYEYILENILPNENVILVGFSDFCDRPEASVNDSLKQLGFEYQSSSNSQELSFVPKNKSGEFSQDLIKRSQSIFDRLESLV